PSRFPLPCCRTHMMETQPEKLPSLLSSLRRADCAIGPRVLASLTTAMACTGVAFLGTWLYALQWTRGRLDDRLVGIAIALAAAGWVPIQIWIWFTGLRGVRLTRVIVVTILLWAAAIPGSLAADAKYWPTGKLV